MPRLNSVEIVFGPTIDVHFTTTLELAGACDTAVLQLTHSTGTELGIRIERGEVADVYLWDAELLIRQHLPESTVTIDGRRVSCAVPGELLSRSLEPAVKASLSINGTPVQTDYPVTLRGHESNNQNTSGMSTRA